MAQTYVSANYQIENGGLLQQDNRPSWRYQSCECCPYGYHIDIDFVRYCEALKERADYTGSINKRRERRRQRQSMEVLLGLVTPSPASAFTPLPQTAEYSSSRLQNQEFEESRISSNANATRLQTALVEDALGDVVNDFERTLERSNCTSTTVNNNTFENTADVLYRVPSNSSMSSGSGSGGWPATSTTASGSNNMNISATCGVNGVIFDLETSNLAKNPNANVNACTLKNIRKQMALGLERMRELEEQVKLIPGLQVQVSILKDEKRKLLEQIRRQNDEICRELAENLQKPTITSPATPSRREVGVMCGVLTRNIGVGPQYARTRTISTSTHDARELKLSTPPPPLPVPPAPCPISRSSQTIQPRRVDSDMQTVEFAKRVTNFGTLAKPETSEFAIQISSQMRTIGVSNDTVNDMFCNKCSILTRTIGVGPGAPSDGLLPISLKSLSVPRSRSFNLGEEKLGHSMKHRTIGCQSESFSINRACQYEAKVASRACQYEPTQKFTNKSVQYESLGISSQHTDTSDLRPVSRDAFSNTVVRLFSNTASNTVRLFTSEACSNTIARTMTDASSNTETLQSSEEGTKKEDGSSSPQVSRIPRPSQSPALSERHKFRRQDTYTKIPAAIVTPTGLSGLDLSATAPTSVTDNVESECTASLSKVKPNFSIPAISSSTLRTTQTNDVYSSGNKQVQASTLLPVSESTLLNSLDRSSRTKAVPSKEMQAAMKVLNDSLQKSKHSGGGVSNAVKSHLKNALNIIQQEWFKVSSVVTANPLDVEDYLDRFEEISSALLQYIVNMTDDSGNTAMHYAVSHGNFDVVSILLDSKVCNINKPNKAGYTSVMLVSLTKLRSGTDSTVVRRLFQLADVNVRACQHGQTALMLAVSHGRLDMVQMLLEAGADINIQDEDGSTALMCAAEHGHIEIVKYFLSHPECDSSIVDVDGSTALKIALEAGHKDIGVLLYAHEHSVHGISPYSSMRQRKTKTSSGASSAAVSRSPSRTKLTK